MIRNAFRASIQVEHPRRPAKSYAFLWAILDGKREDTIHIAMSEQELYDLALECLQVAATLRRLNVEPE